MGGKSIKDMSARERRHHSLAARVFRLSVVHSVILGLVCFLIGFGMYLNAAAQQSMKEAYDTAQNILSLVRDEVDPGVYSAWTMDIYRSLSGQKPDADSASFAEISGDDGYQRMLEILCANRTEQMSDFFFAVPDEQTGKVVFVADTDPRPGHAYPVGKQVGVPGWIQRFFFRQGENEFPRIYYYLPQRGVICVSGAFIREGDPLAGVLFVMIRAEDALHGIRSFTLQYVTAILAAILIMGCLLTRRMKRTLVTPINAIADAAVDYARDKRAGAADTDHFAALNIHTHDEVENLSLVMADMEHDMTAYEENITRITVEKERIGAELSLATRIQAAMLPHVFPPFPNRSEFDIFASMNPAKEVGGDFYDYFLIDDDHLGMVIADVSGKGVPAALFMMASKIIIQSVAMLGKSPAEILTKTNEAVCSNNEAQMFVTVWVGILELSTGKLTAANAGHEYPVLKHPDGHFELYKDKHGFVIGGMEGVKYREYEIRLEPGAKLFVYTDGVPEATNAEKELFGTERMLTALNREPDATPQGILKNVRAAVDGFVKDAEQFDDLTMLCVEYRGLNEKTGGGA